MSAPMRGNKEFQGPDITEHVVGPPRLGEKAAFACPHCGCEGIFLIEVDLANVPSMRGDRAVGTYFGCAACPFATRMLMRAVIDRGERKEG